MGVQHRVVVIRSLNINHSNQWRHQTGGRAVILRTFQRCSQYEYIKRNANGFGDFVKFIKMRSVYRKSNAGYLSSNSVNFDVVKFPHKGILWVTKFRWEKATYIFFEIVEHEQMEASQFLKAIPTIAAIRPESQTNAIEITLPETGWRGAK